MTSAYLVLGLAVALVSVGSILVRLAQAPSLAVAFYRVAVAAVLLAPFAARDARRSWPGLSARHRLVLGASGAALALHFATWIASLDLTSIASSVLLVNTAPLFAVVLSRLFLGETTPPVVLGAIGLALAGGAIIAAGDWASAPSTLGGNALAVAGAATMAVYHVIGRGLRAALPLNAYVLGVWSTAALTLLALCGGFGAPLRGYEPRVLVIFLALAVVPTLGGHGLVNKSLRALPAPTVGLFLLGEPVGAGVLGYLVFQEVPPITTVLGGALVLLALALVLARGT
jgi:drug/metabolite transporter (DMT)-like permease